MGKRMIERDRKTPFIRSHKSCVVLGERGFSDFEIQGSLSLGFYKAIRMKVKCYAIFENQQEVLSEYSNPNQRTFLHYDLADTAKRAPSGPNIQQQQSNNGVWYSTLAQQTNHLHLVLLQGPALQTASSLLAKAIEFQVSKMSLQKMKMKIGEQMRIINANTKMDSLNSNVMELSEIMKGNVNKIIGNLSDLESAEQKSERLSSLSHQFENDSRRLQQKLKRKACIRRLIIGGVLGFLAVFLIYYFLL